MSETQAILALADGRIFRGVAFGATGTSYTDQIMTFTYPHIGNVGVNAQDMESGICVIMVRSMV